MENMDIRYENRKRKVTRRFGLRNILIFIALIYFILLAYVCITNSKRFKDDRISNNITLNGINISKVKFSKLLSLLDEVEAKLSKLKLNDENNREYQAKEIFSFNKKEIIQNIEEENSKKYTKKDLLLLKSIFKKKKNLEIKLNENEDKLNQLLNEILDKENSRISDKISKKGYEIKENSVIIKEVNNLEIYELKKLKEDLTKNILNNIIKEINEGVKNSNKYLEKNLSEIKAYICLKDVSKSKINPANMTKENIENIIDFKAIEEDIAKKSMKFVFSKDEIIKQYMDYLKKQNTEDKKEFEIKLIKKREESANRSYKDATFNDELGSFTTTYDESNIPKATNLKVASDYVTNVVLLPGEIFSYDKLIYPTSKERGFVQGNAYVGGKVVKEYGGGICQVSSTIYNAVLYANLKIVERYNHMFPVPYVKLGTDATYYDRIVDFRFKNNKKNPIKLVVTLKNGLLKASIMGKKEDDITIKIVVKTLNVLKEKEEIKYTNEKYEDEEEVLVDGIAGGSVEVYKETYDKGNLIKKERISRDSYSPLNKVVLRGTKKRN